MKKILIPSLVLLTLTTGLFAGKNFSVTLTANYFIPGDSGYRDIYGSSDFLPEINVRALVYKNFYLWASVSYLKSKGETSPELQEESWSTQTFSTLGAGVKYDINPKLGLRLGAGLLAVRYKEEALGVKISGSDFGFNLEGGLRFDVIEGLFMDLSTGYLSASDKIEGVSIKLGGLKAGIGVGIEF